MARGRKITIHLADGSVSGIRHAEIAGWTGQAIGVPRSNINELKNWDEALRPGVYFLLGVSDQAEEISVYIGEAENICKRLPDHVSKKDFWNEVIFITSKDEHLTKSHVKYLESRLCDMAKRIGRCHLENGNIPQMPVLPKCDVGPMEDFIDNLRVLIGVMGHHFLEPYQQKILHENRTKEGILETEELLTLKNNKIKANAVQTNEGIVVLAGSYAAIDVTDSLAKGYRSFRNGLIEKQVLVEEDDKMKFVQDQLFRSSSQAAAIIVGYPISGPQHWIFSNGDTLKKFEESQSNS